MTGVVSAVAEAAVGVVERNDGVPVAVSLYSWRYWASRFTPCALQYGVAQLQSATWYLIVCGELGLITVDLVISHSESDPNPYTQPRYK